MLRWWAYLSQNIFNNFQKLSLGKVSQVEYFITLNSIRTSNILKFEKKTLLKQLSTSVYLASMDKLSQAVSMG